MKISSLKQDEDYMGFLSLLPQIQQLRSEHRLLQKQLQKKRRRINTFIKKYNFLNEIVAVGGTGTPLSKSVRRALKQVGFTNTHHVDKNLNEDIQLIHGDKTILIEVTGVNNNPSVKKIRQTVMHFLIAKKKHKNRVFHGCFIVNHFNELSCSARPLNPFNASSIKTEIEAADISALTTITLRNMIMDVIRGNLSLDGFIEKLCVTGEVKYNGG